MRVMHTKTYKYFVHDKIVCDKCAKEATAHDLFVFEDFVSIDIHGETQSQWGEGTSLSCDLCYECARALLGRYLRAYGDKLEDIPPEEPKPVEEAKTDEPA